MNNILNGVISDIKIVDNVVKLVIQYKDADGQKKWEIVDMTEKDLEKEFFLKRVDIMTDEYNFSWRFK